MSLASFTALPDFERYCEMSIAITIADAIDLYNSNCQFTVCYCGQKIAPMEAEEFRIEKLRELVAQAGGPAGFSRLWSKDDADKQIDASYISQILNGHRSFGEKAAKNMIRRAGLEPDYFDRPSMPKSGNISKFPDRAETEAIEEIVSLMKKTDETGQWMIVAQSRLIVAERETKRLGNGAPQ